MSKEEPRKTRKNPPHRSRKAICGNGPDSNPKRDTPAHQEFHKLVLARKMGKTSFSKRPQFCSPKPSFGFQTQFGQKFELPKNTSALGSLHPTTWFWQREMHLDEWHRGLCGWNGETSISTLTGLTSIIRRRCTCTYTSAISFMVPGVPAGEGPRRPTSPATLGRESQHHTAGLHLHARPTPSTSTVWKTSRLHHPHRHRVHDGTLYSSAHFEKGLHSTSSNTTTSLDWEARLYEEHLTIWCGNIIDAPGQRRLGKLWLTYKGVTSLLTSESRKGGETPSESLWPTSHSKLTIEQRPQSWTSHASSRVTSMGTSTENYLFNIAIRDLQLQEPQDEEDIEQPQGVRPPVLPHHPQAVAPPHEQHPQQIRPPPGLPQPPQALLHRPPMVKQQAAPRPAPLPQGPPPKVQAASCTSSRTSSSRKALQSTSWTAATSTSSSNTYCDSDWAPDIDSRKSTSGTVTSVLQAPLAFNSRTQSTVATSSAEAELYSISLGISDSLHIYQLLQELQHQYNLTTLTTPKSLTSTKCDINKITDPHLHRQYICTKHITLHDLFVQDIQATGLVNIQRVTPKTIQQTSTPNVSRRQS